MLAHNAAGSTKRILTVEEARTEYLQGKVGRNTLYEALRSGALAHIRIGRRILVTEEALDHWLHSLTRLG